MTDERRYMIEAHDWDEDHDSEHVGVPMSYSQALVALAELDKRAETDSPDPAECVGGVSWHGWSFRLLREDENGSYRPVSE